MLIALPLISGLMAWQAQSATPIVAVRAGTRLGPETVVASYTAERRGDWRKQYTEWMPVPLYVVGGRFYRRHVRGARPVMVYWRQYEYFLPPQDNAWVGWDKRYDYTRQPLPEDWARARGRR